MGQLLGLGFSQLGLGFGLGFGQLGLGFGLWLGLLVFRRSGIFDEVVGNPRLCIAIYYQRPGRREMTKLACS